MSNGHRLELVRDGKGGAFLNYWDSLAGCDSCYHITRHGVVSVSEDGEEHPVNRIELSLLGLLYRLDGISDDTSEEEFAEYMGINHD